MSATTAQFRSAKAAKTIAAAALDAVTARVLHRVDHL
jgi:hypothetical protein